MTRYSVLALKEGPEKGNAMGCDIHVCVEVLDSKKGKWERVVIPNPYRTYRKYDENCEEVPGSEYHPALDPFTGRDYQMFGILAGVRDDTYLQISDPRGLPADVSASTLERYESFQAYAHTPSWLTMSEMLQWADNKRNFLPEYFYCLDKVDKRQEKKNSKALRKRFCAFISTVQFMVDAYCYYASPENVRVVFWFDS